MGYILTAIVVFFLLMIHILALIFVGKNEQFVGELLPILLAAVCDIIVCVIGVLRRNRMYAAFPGHFSLPFVQKNLIEKKSPHNEVFHDPTSFISNEPSLLEKKSPHNEIPTLPSSTRNVLATVGVDRPIVSAEMNLYNDERLSSEEDQSQAEKVVETFKKPGLHSWSFSLPKEGYNLERCADKFNQRYSSLVYRAAVTDGVSASFLPARWAQIVATEYVKENFYSASEFVNWLSNCGAIWNRWVKEEWIPRADEAARIQRGLEYWKHEIEHGSETTLVGCSFSPQDFLTKDAIEVHVNVVGDAEFFLVRQPVEPQGKWRHQSFALTHPEQFGLTPNTLSTSGQHMQDTWQYVQTKDYLVQDGDYLLLTTDALAEWILTSIAQQQNPWVELLSLKDEQQFRRFVEAKRSSGEIHIDDTTLLVVHLEKPSFSEQR